MEIIKKIFIAHLFFFLLTNQAGTHNKLFNKIAGLAKIKAATTKTDAAAESAEPASTVPVEHPTSDNTTPTITSAPPASTATTPAPPSAAPTTVYTIKDWLQDDGMPIITTNEVGKKSLYVRPKKNKLTSLDGLSLITNIDTVEALYISNQSITELPGNLGTIMPNLQLLDLSFASGENKLKLIPSTFASTTKLKTLNLRGNNLTYVSRNLFTNNTSLKKLYLSDNPGINLNVESFADLKKLKLLDLSGNELTKINPRTLADLKNLQTLLLHHNPGIKLTADTFTEVPTLLALDLSNNQKLAADDSSKNQVMQLSDGMFAQLPNLQTLNLSSNRIEKPWSMILKLTTVTFAGLQNLQTLDLSKNMIDHLPDGIFEKLPNLRTLSLADNGRVEKRVANNHNHGKSTKYEITYFPIKLTAATFTGLINLKKLDLRNNYFSKFDPALFAGLANLKRVDLRKNQHHLKKYKDHIAAMALAAKVNPKIMAF